jgi:uncharacterized protein
LLSSRHIIDQNGVCFKRFKELAEGDREHQDVATHMVGLCYGNGDGVVKDEAKAFEWYKKAAEKGHGQAMYYVYLLICVLCQITRMNFLVDHDQADWAAKAIEWYTKAGNTGESLAASSLGLMYSMAKA